MLLAFTMLSFAQMIETDEDFSPFPGGYDYLVDFLDLSFPKERPSREHPYEEVSSKLLLPVYLSSFLFKSTFYFRVVLDLRKSYKYGKDGFENLAPFLLLLTSYVSVLHLLQLVDRY